MRYRRVTYSYSEVAHGGGARQAWIVRSMLGLAGPAWRPPTDFFETAEGLVAYVELAGLSEEDLVVTLYDDELVIEGVRALHRTDKPARFYSVELRDGPFRVELPVPAGVDRDHIRVAYDKGFLVVSMPRLGAPQPSTTEQ